MKESKDEPIYRKGLDEDLDQKYAQYKKKNIWAGNAYHEILTKNEIKILGKLWRKERMTPKQIQVHEMIMLMARISFVHNFFRTKSMIYINIFNIKISIYSQKYIAIMTR